MVHDVFAGRLEDLFAIAVDQGHQAFGANAGCGDLGLHIAYHQVRDADVVTQDMPDRDYLFSAVIDLDGLELQALGIGVDGIHDAATARRQGADIQMMGRGGGKGDQRAIIKHRHDKTHVRHMAGATIGVIMHDHVAGIDALAPGRQNFLHAPDIAGDRSRLQGRGLCRFSQTPALNVDQTGAKILRFPNDRGIGHAHQLVAHFNGDIF